MKLLSHMKLAGITAKTLPKHTYALCVIQDRREGWEHLATCLAVKYDREGVAEYIVWRMHLLNPGMYSGYYTRDLEDAWKNFDRNVLHRILEPKPNRLQNGMLA